MNLFISCAGQYGQKLANELRAWLLSFNQEIQVIVSAEDVFSATRWQEEQAKLSNVDYGIFVLTKENINAPQMLFEAGVISHQTSHLCPILFDRLDSEIEIPFRQFSFISFNQEAVLKLLRNINTALSLEASNEQLADFFDKRWSSFEQAINAILEENKYAHPSKIRYNVAVQNQVDLDFSVAHIFGNDLTNLTIKDLPEKLKQFVAHDVEEKYKLYEGQYDTEIPTTFIVNSTRISTFFVFTDGKSVVLFDRARSQKQTMQVKNEVYDVFGSVQFENYSLYKKISNQDFFAVKVKDILYIPGFALEDNSDQFFRKETVLMVGYAVYLETDDLIKAVNENDSNSFTELYLIQNMPKILTSKAALAKQFLLTTK
ncbi:MAG: hypothetical protein WCK96_17585 [Methylococcales bacterium]